MLAYHNLLKNIKFCCCRCISVEMSEGSAQLINMQTRNDTGWLCSNPLIDSYADYKWYWGLWNLSFHENFVRLISLICSNLSVTAIFSDSDCCLHCDLSFLEADMFLVLIQAMGGRGITFLGQLYYHLGFTICIFFWQWVTNLSHYIMFHFWFCSFSV